MEKVALTQRFMVAYITCGVYDKINRDRKLLQKIINEDLKSIENGKSFELVFDERKKNLYISNPISVPKKMPCGANEYDSNHYPILNCDYCEHKYTEASIKGFC